MLLLPVQSSSEQVGAGRLRLHTAGERQRWMGDDKVNRRLPNGALGHSRVANEDTVMCWQQGRLWANAGPLRSPCFEHRRVGKQVALHRPRFPVRPPLPREGCEQLRSAPRLPPAAGGAVPPLGPQAAACAQRPIPRCVGVSIAQHRCVCAHSGWRLATGWQGQARTSTRTSTHTSSCHDASPALERRCSRPDRARYRSRVVRCFGRASIASQRLAA